MNQQLEKTWLEEMFEKGEARGETEAYRSILRSLLERRFGALPEELIQRLAAANLAKLKGEIDKILDLKSLEELAL